MSPFENSATTDVMSPSVPRTPLKVSASSSTMLMMKSSSSDAVTFT